MPRNSPTDRGPSRNMSRHTSVRPVATRVKAPRKKEQPTARPLHPYPGPAPFGAGGLTRPPLWELVISGEISNQESDLHQRLIEVPPGSRGVIYFDSCGGSAFAGLALAALIRLRQLQAIGVITGECSSAALMPLAACQQRFVIPQSTLLFHPLKWQSDEQVQLVDAREFARHFGIIDTDQDELLARLFGGSADILREWTYPGRFVNGTEFAAAGFATLIDITQDHLWNQLTGSKGSRPAMPQAMR